LPNQLWFVEQEGREEKEERKNENLHGGAFFRKYLFLAVFFQIVICVLFKRQMYRSFLQLSRPGRIVKFPSNFLKARQFSDQFIVKSKYSIPELKTGIVNKPFPLFLLNGFLKEDRVNRAAVVDGGSGKELTFGEAHYWSYSIADALTDLGIKKNDCIAVMSPNHLSYLPIFLGISLTGAISSCLNPLYLEKEINFQLGETNSKTIFVHPACLDRVIRADEKKNLRIIIMDDESTQVDSNLLKSHDIQLLSKISSSKKSQPKHDHAANFKNFDPNSVLTIPFSSGTTGKAKGVLLTHNNLVANTLQADHITPAPVGHPKIVPLPFFHIYGLVIGLVLTSYQGAKLIFLSAFDLVKFLELVQQHKVETAYLVPPIILALAKHPIVAKYNLSSLKVITSGAAPLGSDTQQLCAKRLNCKVLQGWGMTELSPLATYTPLNLVTTVEALKGNSGVLIADTEAKIVHPESGADIDPKEEGEILIRGPQVMKGYLNNPEATKNTLRSDGWLHTGDIGCFDEEGWLYIRDRLKELIKYKGFQVPPAELEALILSMPEVKDVIVIPVLDEEAGEVPRAYVVKQDNCRADFSVDDILEFVHANVAPHKRLRGGIRFTDAIPKSPSGKLLRRLQIEIDRSKNAN
jgi:acyl-CoA synthetase (AMP-forming)/AMP-acid ligase II